MEELFGAGAVAWGLGVLSDCAKAGTTERTARKTRKVARILQDGWFTVFSLSELKIRCGAK